MNIQSERPPFSTISGTSVRLSERDTIAIYRWNDLSWVAHFRDGYGELSDAATWFRVHAGLLRSCRVGSMAALETVELLTPEMVARIARLHRLTDAQRASRAGAATSLAAVFRRACSTMAATLNAWSDRRIDRAG